MEAQVGDLSGRAVPRQIYGRKVERGSCNEGGGYSPILDCVCVVVVFVVYNSPWRKLFVRSFFFALTAKKETLKPTSTLLPMSPSPSLSPSPSPSPSQPQLACKIAQFYAEMEQIFADACVASLPLPHSDANAPRTGSARTSYARLIV